MAFVRALAPRCRSADAQNGLACFNNRWTVKIWQLDDLFRQQQPRTWNSVGQWTDRCSGATAQGATFVLPAAGPTVTRG